MTDPRDTNEQLIGDEQPSADGQEEQSYDEVESRAEESSEVPAARRSDSGAESDAVQQEG